MSGLPQHEEARIKKACVVDMEKLLALAHQMPVCPLSEYMTCYLHLAENTRELVLYYQIHRRFTDRDKMAHWQKLWDLLIELQIPYYPEMMKEFSTIRFPRTKGHRKKHLTPAEKEVFRRAQFLAGVEWRRQYLMVKQKYDDVLKTTLSADEVLSKDALQKIIQALRNLIKHIDDTPPHIQQVYSNLQVKYQRWLKYWTAILNDEITYKREHTFLAACQDWSAVEITEFFRREKSLHALEKIMDHYYELAKMLENPATQKDAKKTIQKLLKLLRHFQTHYALENERLPITYARTNLFFTRLPHLITFWERKRQDDAIKLNAEYEDMMFAHSELFQIQVEAWKENILSHCRARGATATDCEPLNPLLQDILRLTLLREHLTRREQDATRIRFRYLQLTSLFRFFMGSLWLNPAALLPAFVLGALDYEYGYHRFIDPVFAFPEMPRSLRAQNILALLNPMNPDIAHFIRQLAEIREKLEAECTQATRPLTHVRNVCANGLSIFLLLPLLFSAWTRSEEITENRFARATLALLTLLLFAQVQRYLPVTIPAAHPLTETAATLRL